MAIYKHFNKFFKQEYLTDLYKKKVSDKPSVGVDGINKEAFEQNMNNYINIINRKVMNGSYKFTPYKEKLILKGRNKSPRVISIPTLRDKITLATTHKILTEAYKNELNQEIVQTLISQVQAMIKNHNYDYFIKLDVNKFYDRINHNILFKKLKRKARKKEFINLINNAIKTPTISKYSEKPYNSNGIGVPQGLSISNILANIYMYNFDTEHKSEKKYSYFRYVDDILILCNKKDYDDIFNKVVSDMNKLELPLHKNSEKVDSGNIINKFTFLGYKIENKILGIRKQNIHKLENSIANIFTRYKYSNFNKQKQFIWDLNLRITGGIINHNKYGWLFFYSQIEDKEVLYKLDWFIDKMFRRFNININRNRIKNFTKAFNEIKFNRTETSYIPNFDTYSNNEKRKVLIEVFNLRNVNRLNDEEVEVKFKRLLFNTLKKLEKDIQHFS